MRRSFVRTLTELAQEDTRILLLSGDLGFVTLEPFVQRFPRRFYNMGIAEQNMMGVATGLAESGFIPFIYSIVPFAVLRPFEFIRHGPVLHNLPVRIVGVGGGVEYGHEGMTHYGLEDVGVLRTQPNMTIITPADHEQTIAALRATWSLPGPVYYRLAKDDQSTVEGLDGNFVLGQAQLVRDGRDVLFVAMGNIAAEVADAADRLDKEGICAALLVVAFVKPPPTEDPLSVLSRFRLAFTVEEHYVVGGVGSLVSEVIAEYGIACRVKRCGFRKTPNGITGSQRYLRQRFGISSEQLVVAVRSALSDRKRERTDGQ
jgi:transketolase